MHENVAFFSLNLQRSAILRTFLMVTIFAFLANQTKFITLTLTPQVS
jgi:hypothetical protein